MSYNHGSAEADQQFPILLVVHEFEARSPDELSLSRGDRIDLIEKDDDFGDGWYLGRHRTNGKTGLFPQVYTTSLPRAAASRTSALGTNGRLSQEAPTSGGTVSSPIGGRLPQIGASVPASQQQATESRFHDEAAAPPPLNTNSLSQLANLQAPSTTLSTTSSAYHAARSNSMGLAYGQRAHGQDSPVMNETLSVIDEHITDMGTPRHSIVAADRRGGNDSGSEYSAPLENRFSYIPGHETDEEEELPHTEKEISAWTAVQVAEYLKTLGVDGKQCDVLREQEINGEVLLGIDRSTILMPEFELGKLGPRLFLWQKIRALQQEVQGTQQHSRHSSVSYDDVTANVRAPNERTMSQPFSAANLGESGPRTRSMQAMSMQQPSPVHPSPSAKSPLPLNFSSGLPGSPVRPSAASVRELAHSRRHSSADFGGVNNSPRQPSHRKEPSLDRDWTMSTAASNVPRPSSSEGVAAQSTGMVSLNGSKTDFNNVASSADLDRGYFSGGEVENRRNRNVLKKRDTVAQSPSSTYTEEQRRRSATASVRQSRAGSADLPSSAASSSKMVPSLHSLFRGTSLKDGRDSLGKLSSPTRNITSPTVTKLEYDQPKSHVASPRSHNSSSQGSPNPQSPTKKSGPLSSTRNRLTGLRAISDAVTGQEKAMAVSTSQTKDSPLQSPSMTGSSTPPKSIEIEPVPSRVSSGASGKGSKPISRRKKTKKDTSAYRNGLMSKTPQEQMVGCDYSGWMKKKSSKFITLWKPRLFILKGRRLSYYYSENDTKEQGLIDISFHRVSAADGERVTGLHATLTGAAASPASPENATTPTLASQEVSETAQDGIFIFKLSPPRPGFSGTNFTQPEEHYFACDNAAQGKAWMAALLKVTIDLDTTAKITTTYNQQTISLAKAVALKHRPPALRDVDEDMAEDEGDGGDTEKGSSEGGLGIQLGVSETSSLSASVAPPIPDTSTVVGDVKNAAEVTAEVEPPATANVSQA